MIKHHFFSKAFLLLALLLASCQNDNTPVVYEKGSNQYVNNWIVEQMKKYYLWSESLPGNTDLALNPKEYFGKLLNKEDRFSYAVYTSLPETFPKSLRNTYGFDISFVQFEGQTYGVILYVLTDSPAKRAGLKRGQYIKAVNGTLVTGQNYEKLYVDLTASEKAQLQLTEYTATAGFSAVKETEITRGLTFSQPVKYNVLNYNNQKVGYIEIPHFDVGLAGTFLQVFREFQNQSVSKIIVDVRYNGGGDVSSATALSIILAPNIKAGDLFIKFKGNKNGGLVDKSFKEALEMNESKVSFDALKAVHPSVQEVYVLCGNHTASASEIIINNLKPFMTVHTIGEKTVGKDVAGFAIEDEKDKENDWVLYPAIYKLSNARNEGNYAAGIIPSVELNELREMEIFPLGDTREILLYRALNGQSNTLKNSSPSFRTLQPKRQFNDGDPLVQITIKTMFR